MLISWLSELAAISGGTGWEMGAVEVTQGHEGLGAAGLAPLVVAAAAGTARNPARAIAPTAATSCRCRCRPSVNRGCIRIISLPPMCPSRNECPVVSILAPRRQPAKTCQDPTTRFKGLLTALISAESEAGLPHGDRGVGDRAARPCGVSSHGHARLTYKECG